MTKQGSPLLDGRSQLESNHVESVDIPPTVEPGETVPQIGDLPETKNKIEPPTIANPVIDVVPLTTGDYTSSNANLSSDVTEQPAIIPSLDSPTKATLNSDNMSPEEPSHIVLSEENSVGLHRDGPVDERGPNNDTSPGAVINQDAETEASSSQTIDTAPPPSSTGVRNDPGKHTR